MKKHFTFGLVTVAGYLVTKDYQTAMIIAGLWWLLGVKRINIKHK